MKMSIEQYLVAIDTVIRPALDDRGVSLQETDKVNRHRFTYGGMSLELNTRGTGVFTFTSRSKRYSANYELLNPLFEELGSKSSNTGVSYVDWPISPDDFGSILDMIDEYSPESESITSDNANYPPVILGGEVKYTKHYLNDFTQPSRLNDIFIASNIDHTSLRIQPEYEINVPSEPGMSRIDIAAYNDNTQEFTIVEAMSQSGKCDELHYSKTLFTYPRIIKQNFRNINVVLIASSFTEEQINFAKEYTFVNVILLEAYMENIHSEVTYKRIYP